MPKPTISQDILRAALAGFQLDKQRIDAQIAEVQAMLGGSASPEAPTSSSDEAPRKGRRRRSVAARKRMAEAQKARWAKIKSESESVSPELPTPEAPRTKRKISAAGRKAMSEATKKRWAVKKAADAARSAPSKKVASKKAVVKKAAPPKGAKKGAPVAEATV